jgi:hypothetical protein
MSLYECLTLTISAVGVFGGLVAAFVAYQQLRRMAEAGEAAVEANKKATLANVLDIENSIYVRRQGISEAAQELQNAIEQQKKGEVTREALETKKRFLDEAVENYLNSVDRLCASIIRGLIPEDEYKRDYRILINEIMGKDMYKPFFHAGTPFRNIVSIHGKWADE